MLEVEIGPFLERPLLNGDVVGHVFLGLVSAAIGSLLRTLIDPFRRTMNLNVKLPAIATFVDHTAVNKKRNR